MSAVFTYDDVIEALRERLPDTAQLLVSDEEVLSFHVPRALQALFNERPDIFIGAYSALAMKPVDQSGLIQIDDVGMPLLVETVLATVMARMPKASDPAMRPKGAPHNDPGEMPVMVAPRTEPPVPARPPVPPKA